MICSQDRLETSKIGPRQVQDPFWNFLGRFRDPENLFLALAKSQEPENQKKHHACFKIFGIPAFRANGALDGPIEPILASVTVGAFMGVAVYIWNTL